MDLGTGKASVRLESIPNMSTVGIFDLKAHVRDGGDLPAEVNLAILSELYPKQREIVYSPSTK